MTTPRPGLGGGQLNVQTRTRDGVFFVSLAGDLDARGCPSVDAALSKAQRSGTERIVIDLTEVDFIDSSGIALLIAAMNDAQGRATQLGVVPSRSADVQRLIELCGLRDVMPFIE